MWTNWGVKILLYFWKDNNFDIELTNKVKVMKKDLRFTLYMIFALLFSIPNIYAKETKDVVPSGRWGIKMKRSFVPAPPTISTDTQTLFIYFRNHLSDLAVTIYDENEKIIYQDVISSHGGGVYLIPIDDSRFGEYRIVLEHKLGILTGTF
jgi:hypothetical protein